MNNVIVIYKSKYGSTKKYADWIAHTLNCKAVDVSSISKNELLTYDTIVYGGGLYAGGINGSSVITKNFDAIKNKNLIIYTVGLSNPTNTKELVPIINKVFTEEMQKEMSFFHLRGAMDYPSLTFTHRIMMKMLKTILSKKKAEELSDEDKGILNTYGKSVDFTSEASITPLIEKIKAL